MYEQTHELSPGGDGAMTTFVVRPDRDGPHPVVLFLMDAAGIREELRTMARRLATSGYYVILPNLFHRSGVLELPPEATMDDMSVLLHAVTRDTVLADCAAALALADGDPAAWTGRAGVVGYCMTGKYAMQLPAVYPGRIVAAASFHGVDLLNDSADSPHLSMVAEADYYFGCAELDRWAPLTMVDALARYIAGRGLDGEVEIYRGCDHGFVFPSRDGETDRAHAAVYDRAGDDRHWERLIALLRRSVG
ncbi:dienelactone hydrolase family protein [Sphingomonas immobilis]|uniref:Dienelactone hydrolase family protein n=1 Tax=Sphingomonas immobilis TaxID=3063997 RepID=A0ABT8ZX45_9SPHN|nr:dienelactone hydrolase family protein [Sphingomonas sp. CA1-15]MDO7842145.1 dienelactone hydrolase family protein [Sphingomonas sp. CA1-15]